MFDKIGDILGRIVEPVTRLISEKIEDRDLRAQLQAEITQTILQHGTVELTAQRDVLLAEMQGSSAQRNWRPHLMYLFMFLIAFNGVVVPLVSAFSGLQLPVLEAYSAIPDKMWDIIMLCLGGYIGGRTVEKVAREVAPALGRRNGE